MMPLRRIDEIQIRPSYWTKLFREDPGALGGKAKVDVFFQKLNKKVEQLNRLIDGFNLLTDNEKKASQLQQIKVQVKDIQNGALDRYVSLSPSYHQQLNGQLCDGIRGEEKKLPMQPSVVPIASTVKFS